MEEANTQSLRLQRGVWWFIFARERVCIRIYLWRLPIQIYQFKCAPIEKWWLTLKMVHPTAINQQSLSVRKSKSYRPTLFLTVDTILNAESKLFKTLSWIGSLFGSVTRGGVSVIGRKNEFIRISFVPFLILMTDSRSEFVKRIKPQVRVRVKVGFFVVPNITSFSESISKWYFLCI